MAEKKSLGKFFVYCGLAFILFLVAVPIIFSFGGKLIRAEIIIFLFLIFLSLVSFLGYHRSWGEKILFFVFLLYLANLLFIWYFTKKLFVLPLFLSLVGFLLALPKKAKADAWEKDFEKAVKEDKPALFSQDFDEEKKEAFDQPEAKPKPEVKYSPGKYLASQMSNVYHIPTCDWAKKIAAGRRVWFADKKDAKKKGYRPHSCVDK